MSYLLLSCRPAPTWMRLDGLWASLFLASSLPAPGLTADLYSCSREFAPRFLQRDGRVTCLAVSLRFTSTDCVGYLPTR